MTTQEQVQRIVDYAKPLITIEFMQRVIHDACLNKDYANARKVAFELLAEAKMLTHTLAMMQEEQEKRNK